MRSEATDGPERHTTLSSHALGRVGWVLPSLRSLPQSWPVKDAKLGRCIVRSEFSEYSVTAREKRLQTITIPRKRLPPHDVSPVSTRLAIVSNFRVFSTRSLPVAPSRANHDDAREDEHGGDADGEAHCVDAAKAP